MSEVKSYRDLKIWQRGILLSKQVYELTMSFPKEEVYGITSQMRRCSVSVPSNIAEGFGRSTLSFLNFLKIARGSLYELDTQLVLTRELELSANTELIGSLELEIQEMGKMINSFINKLKEKL
ncbi:MAG: four helix bundle protein [Fluviicola sp.]|nr:four helix bundle protein [Fluviicola sp.]